jgi:GAF domain-containing protein
MKESQRNLHNKKEEITMNITQSQVKDVIKDPERLQEIVALDLFSEEVKNVLDDVTQKAAERFNLPIGLVSLVLDEAQFWASKFGIDEGWMSESLGTDVEWSFCQYAVKENKPFVVENALENDLVKDTPLVENEGIRCYAGIPMTTSKGQTIGSFCVVGPEERSFSEEDLNDLRELAEEAVLRIERRAGRDV